QVHGTAGAIHLVRGEVDRYVAEAAQRAGRRAAAADPVEELRRALHGGDDALVVEGLEQVVEGVDLEGPQRVLVVRGHEHDRGSPFLAGRGRDGEAVEV